MEVVDRVGMSRGGALAKQLYQHLTQGDPKLRGCMAPSCHTLDTLLGGCWTPPPCNTKAQMVGGLGEGDTYLQKWHRVSG